MSATLDALAGEAAGRADRRPRSIQPIHHCADRARRSSRSATSSACSRTRRRPPSARASCASACPARSDRATPRPRRRCARSPAASEPWAALGSRARRGALRRERPRRAHRGPAPTTSPASSGSRATGAPAHGAPDQDLDRVLGLQRRLARRARRVLRELADRDINLTKIESRPRRVRLGHYMFFADLDGRRAGRRAVRRSARRAARARRGAAGARLLPRGLTRLVIARASATAGRRL